MDWVGLGVEWNGNLSVEQYIEHLFAVLINNLSKPQKLENLINILRRTGSICDDPGMDTIDWLDGKR